MADALQKPPRHAPAGMRNRTGQPLTRRPLGRTAYWSPVASDGRSDIVPGRALIGEHTIDLLRTAVVDITTLVATCHALKSLPSEGETVLQRKPRSRLRRDLKRGAVAYIDVLARTRRGAVDDALLSRCRVAAEQQMPHALAQQDRLRRLMVSGAGSLDGMAAARQDLWRLAHVAIFLGTGIATLRGSSALIDAKSADTLGDTCVAACGKP